MKIILSVLVLSYLLSPITAETNDITTERIKTFPQLQLRIVRIIDAKEHPYILMVNTHTAFRSLEGLKTYLAGLPRGSGLTWAPRCCRFKDEPLQTMAELDNLRNFCKKHAITFTFLPSG